jgi:hypothetical protein
MKIYLSIFWILIPFWGSLDAAEWQWSVKLDGFISPETTSAPEAFLWIPNDCNKVRGIVVGQHNMCEETIFENPIFRKNLQESGLALIWITPGISYQWDVKTGCQDIFDKMLVDLANKSGYEEIKDAPIIPIGHSAMATFPWNFAAWNPNRTLAIISYKGDAPRTNLTGYGGENLEWGRTQNIDGIPGLMIEGEYEWWEARVNPALAFRMMYPESCVSFLCDVRHGHFDVSDKVVEYISLFIKKAVQYRLQKEGSSLKKINTQSGWLAQRWSKIGKRPKTASYIDYKGNKHDAFWYFDKEMAEATEQYYAISKGEKMQYISYKQDGEILSFNKTGHVQYNLPFKPEKDGITFHLSAVHTDSLHLRQSDNNSGNSIIIDRINGPVSKINDTTFQVRFYRMGFENRKRTNEITLVAHSKGNNEYKSAVQEISVKISYPLQEGKRQYILFGGLPDISPNSNPIILNAVSDCDLPVHYYIKEGPAKIDGNILTIGQIPSRAKFPLKVTVVAWQYGLQGKIQTAEAVERSFYINN